MHLYMVHDTMRVYLRTTQGENEEENDLAAPWANNANLAATMLQCATLLGRCLLTGSVVRVKLNWP